MKRLNLLNDFLFQKIMGEKGDEEQLLSFLNAVLRRTRKDNIISVEILENTRMTADLIGNKTSILDVRSKLDDGTSANIEVQLLNLGDMDKRSLFYWAREYSKGIKAGEAYKDLSNVIAINIINFEFINVEDFHSSFHLWEDFDKDCLLTDALEIHFIDMVKFRRLQEKDIEANPLHRWLCYFDKNSNTELIERVIKMDATIQKVQEKIEYLSSNDEQLRLYELRERTMFDQVSMLQNAKRENSIEIAKKMLKRNTSIEIVTEDTGLDETTIKKLQNDIDKEM